MGAIYFYLLQSKVEKCVFVIEYYGFYLLLIQKEYEIYKTLANFVFENCYTVLLTITIKHIIFIKQSNKLQTNTSKNELPIQLQYT